MKRSSAILLLLGSMIPGLIAQSTFGKVVMADGSPVPSGLSITRTCGVVDTRTVAYTDSKGYFSFQSGQSEGIPQDASNDRVSSRAGSTGNVLNGGTVGLNQSNNLSLSQPLNCELKVNAPGFRSDVVKLRNGDIGTIVLHGLANVEGTSVSATSRAAPGDVRKAYEKGLESAAKGKSADAQKDFEKAVAIYPQYANAWLDLGRERLKAHLDDPAHDAFVKALAADDKLAAADAELGMMASRAQNWKEAAAYLDATTRLDPIDYAQLRFPAAVAEYNVRNFEAAERNVREALKNDPAHPNPQQDHLLGVLLLKKGDLAGGVEELRTYLRLAPAAPDADRVKTEIEQAESILAAAGAPAAPPSAH